MNRRFFLALIASILSACSMYKVKLKPTKNREGQNEPPIKAENNLYGTITDTDGHPLPNVPVSDGYQIVLTDSNGFYQMKADPRSTFVYYSLPAGYAIIQNEETHLAEFFQKISPNVRNKRNFILKKLLKASDTFTFAVLGDIHVRDDATCSQFSSRVMRPVGEYFRQHAPKGLRFGISLGDIIDDAKNPETFNLTREALGNCPCGSGEYLPFYTVIGNHDHNAFGGDSRLTGTEEFDLGAVRDYMEAYGPTCYSFNIGKVHFISLDDYIARQAKTNGSAIPTNGRMGLSEDVYRWLLSDLDCVEDKASKMVVILAHVQLRGVKDAPHRDDMIERLAPFNSAYLFTANAHICESYKYEVKTRNGRSVMERIHGVPMGNFWYSQYCPDGASAGFYVYHVDGNDFSSWEYRSLHDSRDQMRVYDSNDVYDKETDWSHKYVWSNESLFAGGNFLLAHIYHGDEDWEVTLEHDGKTEKMTFANKRIYDYCVNAHLVNDNVPGIKTSFPFFWDRSENWWYLKLDRPASELRGWKVVAKARFPGSKKVITYTCDRITRTLSETT